MTVGEYLDSLEAEMREDLRKEIQEKVREETRKELREEVREEAREEDIATCISILQELGIPKENARNKLIEKYPDLSKKADALIERYWKENV